MMSRLASWWLQSLKKRPVITNTVVYASFYTAAELSQQIFNKMYSPEKPELDLKSAGRIVTAGSCLYAPTLYYWYKFLDRKFAGTAVKAVASKVLCDQLIMTPILLAAFFTTIGLLEGKEDVFEELRAKYWRTFVANQAYWIPGQTINFYFIPPNLRVVYVASASFIWINVLCFIKRQKTDDLIDYIREKLQNIIENPEAQKLFYRRSEEYGFYYWRKCCYVDVNQYVRVITVSNKTKLNESDLEKVLTEVSYQPLPFNDEGLFQILIANQKLDNNNSNDYAIIFRVHHTLGDGVALIEFLCKTLADKDDSIMFCLPERNPMKCRKTPAYLFRMISLFIDMFSCFVDGILRESDRSTLHGPPLVGKKIYKWIEPDESLFSMIKDIKANVVDLKFSDILATALSCGLRDYFLKEVDPAPNSIAVILPIRFPCQENNALKLENNFTVSILDLPIGTDVKIVKRRIDRLQESADPLANYYFLKICGILPKDILQPLFNSSQASMVLSNLPGPQVLSICGGDLKSLVFFVPNKGNTGLGVTALSYGGVLRFAAMADTALVSNSHELAIILEGMVDEIVRLHKK